MAKDTVDTRVVRMEFDNKQFEKNIKQTSKSLDKFKEDLDFKGVGDSLDKVKLKFSALQIAATTFVVNLTNRIIELGKTMIKSLSVDNIAAGWTKFGEKTTSVATMMAQKIRIAGREITDLAEKTAIVNEQLELLTWFADETSYSFTDMVNNIGKFTAAGQDLDSSVKAMEGIATWAALSGQNATTASRAMYQLAQAMGKGKIQKIDWMSIQNANMDTEEFRETILATAVALGELTKEGDKFVTKTGKKFTQSQFADFLSEGWFTSEVLVKGLNKYSAAIDQIYEIAEREGITASEVMERYGDQLDEFGVKAFKAAQEARTFLDVINSVKDAVSSKWMQTFENIFGNQEEAVKLWTELANELYDVFAESGNFRNDILSIWKEFGGRDDIFGEHGTPNQGAFWNLYDAIIAVRDLIKKAWNRIFPITQMESISDQAEDIGRQLKDLTKRIRDFTNQIKMSDEISQRLSKTFQVIFSLLKIGAIALKTIRFIIDPIIELGKQLVSQVLDQILYTTNKIIGVENKLENAAIKLQSFIVDLLDSLNLTGVLDEAFALIKDVFNVISESKPIESFTRFINDFIETFREAGGTSENFVKIMTAVLSIVGLVRRIIISVVKVLVQNVLPVLNDVIDIIVKIAGYILGLAVKIISTVADLITQIIKALEGEGNLDKFAGTIFDILDQLGAIARSAIPVIGSLVSILLKLVEVVLLIPHMLNELSKSITGNGIIENLTILFDSIVKVISDFVNGIKNSTYKVGSIPAIFQALLGVVEGVFEVIRGLAATVQLLLTILGSALKKLGFALQYIAETFIKIFSGNLHELTKVEKIVLGVLAILAILALIFVAIYNMYWLIQAVLKPWSVLVDSLTGYIDAMAKATLFDSLAAAIFTIAVSLMLIGGMNIDALGRAVSVLLAFTIVIAAFAAAIAVIDKKYSQVQNNNLTNKNGLLSQISSLLGQLALMMISIALFMKIIGGLNVDSLYQSMISFMAILFALVGATVILNKQQNISNTNKITAPFLGMSLFLITLALSLKILSTIDSDILYNAVYDMMMILGLMGLMLIILNKSGKKVSDALPLTSQLIAITLLLATTVAAIAIIASMDPGKFWASFAGLAAIMLLYGGLLVAINKLSGPLKDSIPTIVQMIGVTVLLVAAVASIRILADIDAGSLWKAFGIIAGLLAVITGMILLISRFGKKANPQAAVIKKQYFGIAVLLTAMSLLISSIAGSLALITGVINQIAAMAADGDSNKGFKIIWNSVAAMLALLLGISFAIISITRQINMMSPAQAAATIMMLGGIITSIVALSASLLVLKDISYGKMWSSVMAMLSLMAGMTVAIIMITKQIKVMSPSETVGSIMMLGGLVAAIVTLSSSILILKDIPYATIWSSVVAMLSLLAGIVAAFIFVSAIVENMDSFSKIGRALLVIGSLVTSVTILAASLRILNGVPWQTIAVSALALISLMITLGGLVVAIKYLMGSGNIAGSVLAISLAFTLLSASTLLLALAMQKMQDVEWMSIAKGLAALAGAIAVLGIASVVLEPVAATMLKIASVMLIVGIALLSAGTGVFLVAKAIEILNQDMTQGLENLGEMLKIVSGTIIEAFIGAIERLLEVIPSLLDTIIASAKVLTPKLVELVEIAIDGILQLIYDKGESIIHAIVDLITWIVEAIAENSDKIIGSLGTIIMELTKWINDNIESLVEMLNNIVVKVFNQLSKDIGPITNALLEFLTEATKALFESEKLDALIRQVTKDVTLFTMKVLNQLMAWIVPLSTVVTAFILEMIAYSIAFAIVSLGAISKMVVLLLTSIILMVTQVAIGLMNVVKEALLMLMWNIVVLLNDVLYEVGKVLPTALFGGMASFVAGIIDALLAAINSVIADAPQWLKDIIGWLTQPLSNYSSGLRKFSKGAADETILSGQRVKQAAETAFGNITNTVSWGLDKLGDVLSSSMDAINAFGKSMLTFSAGTAVAGNVLAGMAEGIANGDSSVEDSCVALVDNMVSSTEDGLGINSPSKVFMGIGDYMMQGLSLGIQNGSQEASNSIVDAISNSLQLAEDILRGREEYDYVIKVGMDISNVEAETARIQDIMSGVSNPNVTAAGRNANYAGSAMERNNHKSDTTSTTDNSTTVTYNNTFNIESTDPQQSADEIDKVLQNQNMQWKLAHGKI